MSTPIQHAKLEYKEATPGRWYWTFSINNLELARAGIDVTYTRRRAAARAFDRLCAKLQAADYKRPALENGAELPGDDELQGPETGMTILPTMPRVKKKARRRPQRPATRRKPVKRPKTKARRPIVKRTARRRPTPAARKKGRAKK